MSSPLPREVRITMITMITAEERFLLLTKIPTMIVITKRLEAHYRVGRPLAREWSCTLRPRSKSGPRLRCAARRRRCQHLAASPSPAGGPTRTRLASRPRRVSDARPMPSRNHPAGAAAA
jgi:hypothetical protein